MGAWIAGANVVLTDLHENLDVMERAVTENGAGGLVHFASLDWCAPLPPELRPATHRWDVVIAADCKAPAALKL